MTDTVDLNFLSSHCAEMRREDMDSVLVPIEDVEALISHARSYQRIQAGVPGEVEDLIHQLQSLAGLYPEDIFRPLSEDDRAAIPNLTPEGLSDRIAAHMGRHWSKWFTQAADALIALQTERDSARQHIAELYIERDTALCQAREQAIEEVALVVEAYADIEGLGDVSGIVTRIRALRVRQ